MGQLAGRSDEAERHLCAALEVTYFAPSGTYETELAAVYPNLQRLYAEMGHQDLADEYRARQIERCGISPIDEGDLPGMKDAA